jgi:hypothetical protein
MILATEIDTQTGSRLLTNSRMTCAKTCLKKHYWAYELGLRPAVDAKPLRMGRAVHRAVEFHAKGMTGDEAILAMLAEFDAAKPVFVGPESEPDWNIERETVVRLLGGYFWRWGEMSLEHLAVEKVFEGPINNPETGGTSRTFGVSGMIDGIVLLPDGRLAVKEVKTCSDDIADPASDYWLRLRIDQQISLYFRAAERMAAAGELPEAPQTILYDVIRKPAIGPLLIPILDENGIKIVADEKTGERIFKANGEPRQSGDKEKGWVLQSRRQTPEEYGERLTADIGANPDFYYQRKEIPRVQSDLDDFDLELWQMSRMLGDCQRFARWPRNTSACIGFGKCPYFGLCTSGWKPTGEADVPQGYARLQNVHPELSQGAKP